ncbi:hypothetical protein GCM10009105_21980 [Dokdonella soli]|uniref:Uncharacterized protein n=1 Tax=Dokdonella soli TaxID=529810 RepID=A0ABP3TQM7_9GAMM
MLRGMGDFLGIRRKAAYAALPPERNDRSADVRELPELVGTAPRGMPDASLAGRSNVIAVHPGETR